MHTVVADKWKRVRIPDAMPKQLFAYTNNGDGTRTLTEVKAEPEEKFPPGSLLKYFTGEAGRERNELETAIVTGCLQGPPE
ncbi:MAG: hypothetical protein NT154_05540 [Verrucomicrobia bacterium]|nr:hypothetical protein [Verrucomicrobiota bacterium]